MADIQATVQCCSSQIKVNNSYIAALGEKIDEFAIHSWKMLHHP